jgi:2-polyprenyl-6-methoxyphenol hydroxylase-like FAD-dependent oxidoreductase
VPSWSRERIVLLEDAASSITILGEGASMALAGASALADAIAETHDVDGAVAAYEREHRPRVTAAQRGAGYGPQCGYRRPRAVSHCATSWFGWPGGSDLRRGDWSVLAMFTSEFRDNLRQTSTVAIFAL